MRRSSLMSLLVPLALGAVGTADAQSASADMNVQITIQDGCDVTATPPTDLDFGTTSLLTADIDQTATITVTCTEAAPYDVGLGGGTSGDTAARTMTGTGGDVAYQLYQDAARTEVWGDLVGTDTVDATGTGVAQTHTVYGRVPPQPTPPAGTYTDTVAVTVTW